MAYLKLTNNHIAKPIRVIIKEMFCSEPPVRHNSELERIVEEKNLVFFDKLPRHEIISTIGTFRRKIVDTPTDFVEYYDLPIEISELTDYFKDYSDLELQEYARQLAEDEATERQEREIILRRILAEREDKVPTDFVEYEELKTEINELADSFDDYSNNSLLEFEQVFKKDRLDEKRERELLLKRIETKLDDIEELPPHLNYEIDDLTRDFTNIQLENFELQLLESIPEEKRRLERDVTPTNRDWEQ